MSAVITKGYLGGFRGKLGKAVGYHLNGQDIIRTFAEHPFNPRTEAQVIQRCRFKELSLFLSCCLIPIKFGFPNHSERHTPYNVAVSANFSLDPFIVVGTDVTLDYTKITLSAGNGILPGSPSAQVGASNTVQLSWTDNSGISPNVLSSDHVIACLYCPDYKASAYDTSSAVRGDESLTLSYPPLWAGSQAYLYLFLTSHDFSLVTPTLLVATLTLT